MSSNSNSASPHPPYHINSRGNRPLTPPKPKPITYVSNPSDGSILLDHNNNPITVDKILATKPLKHELSTRPGPGNKRLTYISGDGISRTLNDIFGFDGWNLDIVKVERVETLQNQGKHTAIYTAHVRLTHKASGTYKEDVGMGDSTDRSFATAVGHAIKASITDAMKRAARHFGDKLGNSLYESSFSFKNAPKTLKEALDRHDIERCNAKFGFPKDQKPQQPSTLSGQAANPLAVAVATTITSTSNGSGQAGVNMGGATKNNAIATIQYQAPSHQGNRVPLSNLSGNAKPLIIIPQQPQQQQGDQDKSNFSFTPMPASNPKPSHGHQQPRQPIKNVYQQQQQQQQPVSDTTATSNNPATTNRCNNTTVVPQSRNPYNSNASSNRAAPQELQPSVSNFPIGPPPTSTDTLKNSNLFSYPSQPTHPTILATATTSQFNTGSAPPSRRGRFSMDGQRPIQGAPFVTPTASHHANSSNKRPNDAAVLDESNSSSSNNNNNKRHCRPINPYASI
ncbi:MAG: hypothetical protein SGBAC_006383 [Bacillariaceae sp.]